MVSLPLTGSDIEQAQGRLKSDSEVQNFIFFIKGLDVYPDHANPKEIRAMENKDLSKKYYIAPFFQASDERRVVGGQELADEGIKIIMEVKDLVSAFDFEIFKIILLMKEERKKNQTLDKLRKNLPKLSDQNLIDNYKILIAQLEKEIRALKLDLNSLEEKAEMAIEETSQGLRQQVANQISLRLAFLGVVANTDEKRNLESRRSSDLREAISSLIARASDQGQFGFRNAIYEAGYTNQQRKWIMLYKAIRPDVHVTPLATKAVFARTTALTAKHDNNSDLDYFHGNSGIVRGSRMFLAVNGGSRGACGNTASCNVILEYTWLGASMAKSAKFGAVVMPIYFEADVSFMQPAFDGTISCDFKNGFEVKGRADVKDGAVIYDGDVYNQINYNAIEDGDCDYNIRQGDADSAAYYTIKRLYEYYMNLKTERAAKSRSEKDHYRNYINRELTYHANNSQKKNYDVWSMETWSSTLGSGWGSVATFVIETARDFYWHTRIEDSTTSERVNFTTTLKESNVQKTEKMAFDGFTLLCWKGKDGNQILAACPSNKTAEYQKRSDTDLGKSQQFCEELDAVCFQEVEEAIIDPNEDGVLEDPYENSDFSVKKLCSSGGSLWCIYSK